MNDIHSPAALFIASFNRDLAALKCPAQVSLPSDDNRRDVIELQDAEGNFLGFVPESASPELVAVTYGLYVQGLRRGIQVGEQAAWARLRLLIGAAAAPDS
jgi:hypothetical protein